MSSSWPRSPRTRRPQVVDNHGRDRDILESVNEQEQDLEGLDFQEIDGLKIVPGNEIDLDDLDSKGIDALKLVCENLTETGNT